MEAEDAVVLVAAVFAHAAGLGEDAAGRFDREVAVDGHVARNEVRKNAGRQGVVDDRHRRHADCRAALHRDVRVQHEIGPARQHPVAAHRLVCRGAEVERAAFVAN